MKYVYHSSKIQNLKTIEPRVSTHGNAWVYAMEKPEYCLMFLGNHSDIINQTGFTDGIPFIAERFKGALEYAYKNKTGSIYTLEAAGFKSGLTSFIDELTYERPCEVIAEKKISDALDDLLKLEAEEKIKIYRFPHLPSWMPSDKSDLIEKVVTWSKSSSNTIPDSVKEFHPDILEEVIKRLT